MTTLYTSLGQETDGIFKKLIEWDAPERQWTQKTRAWYVVYSLFFVAIIFIGALIQEYIFIVAVIAFAFLWFVQGSMAPLMTTYMITSIGVKIFDKLYKWTEVKHFWFSLKSDTIFLNLEVTENPDSDYVKRIPLIINPNDMQKIFDILIQYIDYGDRDEVSFNIFTSFVSGKYFDISEFIAIEEDPDKTRWQKLGDNFKKLQRKKTPNQK